METLYVQTGKKLETFLLNTKIPSGSTDRIINEILDLYPNSDWWIEEGWAI